MTLQEILTNLVSEINKKIDRKGIDSSEREKIAKSATNKDLQKTKEDLNKSLKNKAELSSLFSKVQFDTAYHYGDTFYSNGKVYTCNSTGNYYIYSGDDLDDKHWLSSWTINEIINILQDQRERRLVTELLVDEWEYSKDYKVGDIVSYNGYNSTLGRSTFNLYRCIVDAPSGATESNPLYDSLYGAVKHFEEINIQDLLPETSVIYIKKDNEGYYMEVND